VGRQVLSVAGRAGDPAEVIGVVADVRYEGLAAESRNEVYVPLRQVERLRSLGGFASGTMVVVRTAGDPVAAVPFLREAVAAANPNATVDEVMTMDARLSAAIEQPRFYAVFVGFFAALALFLAAFGIYALLSYTSRSAAGRSGSAWPSAPGPATSSPSSSGRGPGSSRRGPFSASSGRPARRGFSRASCTASPTTTR